jgi:hypothetical protein
VLLSLRKRMQARVFSRMLRRFEAETFTKSARSSAFKRMMYFLAGILASLP